MKELSIEEKAKAYDEAKLRMSAAYNSNRCTIGFMNEIFPELKDSYGERTRKWLIEMVEEIRKANPTNSEHNGNCSDAIAWLEKQGEKKEIDYNEELKKCKTNPLYFFDKYVKGKFKEQKPAWSEEDERQWNNIWDVLDGRFELSEEGYRSAANWFKSIKDRVQPQPKQEWSKEDKERYISCLQRLSTGNPEQPETINSKWFKEHVYPKSQWKPSDAQMASITCAVRKMKESACYDSELVSLLNDLKKLKG